MIASAATTIAQQGNAKHQAAVATTRERVLVLRSEISEELDALVELTHQLDAIAGTHLVGGLGFMTPEGKDLANRQARTDRAAARGMHAPRRVGLKILNSASVLGTGQVDAPVAMTAVSASAAILFTLRHHINKLARSALRVALEVEQTSIEDLDLCPWPRNPLVAIRPTSDGDVDELARQLRRLVDVCANRPRLAEILRDLEHNEQAARDVVYGPARTNYPDPCPWCGRESLVIYHRMLGRSVQIIRCEGRHPCVCDYEYCACHADPVRSRHDWENSGRATQTWHDLRDQIAHRKETARMEPLALTALEAIAAMHQPTWTDDEGRVHQHMVFVFGDQIDRLVPDHVCIEVGLNACQIDEDEPEYSMHSVPGCVECQVTVEDQVGSRIWPCATYRATQLDTDSPNPKE